MEEENDGGPAAGKPEEWTVCAGEPETWWQRFRWWWWTRVPPRRCCACACKALPDGTDRDANLEDPRIGAGTHGTVEHRYPWGLWVCYSCFHYGEP
jgi:hypothetical protein